MRSKFSEVLTVGSITLILLAPPLLVFGWIWQWHLNSIASMAVEPLAVKPLQVDLPPASFLPPHSSEPPIALLNLLFGAILSIPVSFWLGMLWSEKSRLHRSLVRQRQVAELERLWQRTIQPE